MLQQIRAFLHDAEEREIRDAGVELWLKELKEVAYDLEDVIDRCQYEVLQAQVDYWRQHLANAPARLNLPTEHVHPLQPTRLGARQNVLLPLTLLEQVRTLSQQAEVTLFMTLLAAFQVLLMRYSGQEDILVGTPIANRTQIELESMLGFFVNTLVLRTDLSGNPTFQQVLKSVRETTLEAYAHQDLPFEKLVDSLQLQRSPAYSPLVQVCFVLQNTPQEALDLPGVSFQLPSFEWTTAKFDLFTAKNGQYYFNVRAGSGSADPRSWSA